MRYFLGQDQSGHHYIVQVNQRDAWAKWSSLPDEDELGWTVPWYAIRLGVHPSAITFENPMEGI